MRETKVKCSVSSCQHNDCECCNLEVLDISCTCDGDCCKDKKETVCKSFSERKN